MRLSALFQHVIAASGITEPATGAGPEYFCGDEPEFCPCCEREKFEPSMSVVWFLLGMAVCMSVHAARIQLG
jgi:hypothetical protein